MSPTVSSAVLTSDHGVLVLAGGPLAEPWDENNLLLVGVEEAMGDMWIQTGSQWGPFEVTAALHEEPAPLAAVWEDSVEVSIEALGPVWVNELSGEGDDVPLISDPGSYRLRVSARGRLADQYRDDDDGESTLGDDPVEWYLVEAWPAPHSERAVLRMTSHYALNHSDNPELMRIPEAVNGLAASKRVGADVDGSPGARVLSGETGTVRVERTVQGTRRKLFPVVSHVTSWSSWRVMRDSWTWGGWPGYEIGPRSVAYSGNTDDRLSGSTGAIYSWFIEVDRPRLSVRYWNWGVPVAGKPDWEREMFLPVDTQVTTTLTTHRDDTGDSWTTITHEHADLPVEWLDDMRDWWTMQFAILERMQEERPTT